MPPGLALARIVLVACSARPPHPHAPLHHHRSSAAHHRAGCASAPTHRTIMCPPVPVLALLNINISDSWSDEELVRFLAERKARDPLPQNVLVGMNLDLIDPRGSPGNIWYMNWSDDQQPCDNGENAIRKAKNGYWKSVDALRIPTSTSIVGVKICLEFYEGQAPSGKRTGWVMHEYQVEQNHEANVPQDYKSLCTVFLQGDKKLNAEGQQISLNANAPDDRLESYLQYIAGIEEQNAALNSQIVASNQQNFSSSNGQDEQNTNAADAMAFHHALANEAYIEMNDLLSSEASASTSECSSTQSRIFEEYFDSDAFLREISNDRNTTDEEHKDCKFSIAAPTKSDHVVISPAEQGLVHNHGNNATVCVTSLEKSVPDGGRDQQSNEECLQHNPSPSSHAKRSRSNSSNSSQGSTKSPQRDRSIGKFGKLGKKYCCFGSF